ncbi:acyl-CoA dehydrogenase family protein [Nocardia sp. 004]|uniref:acyl-CoA dehydrogenase family protein n=1 Tax=Nocardia sp. 004 TaxID=3385978 RepID=UPI0039A03DF7
MSERTMEPDLSRDEIRRAIREFSTERPGVAEVRAFLDADPRREEAGFDRSNWTILAEQLGVASLGAPESWGGLGLGVDYLVAAIEECGAGLYPGPARAALLMAWALGGLDPDSVDPDIAEVVRRFLMGAAVPGAPLLDAVELPECSMGRLRGTATAVTHGAVADLVVCPVRTPDGLAVALAVVDPAAERIVRPSADPSTPVADISFAAAPAVLVTEPADVMGTERFATVHRLLCAAEQVGGAEGCLAAMVSYAKVRQQFGALIGSYQAIQHRCAATAVTIASARALVAAGATAAARDGDVVTARQLSLLAGAEAGECANAAADSFIQISGGIGFTWEHDAHLFYRRARTAATIGGTPERLRSLAVTAGCAGLLVTAAT